MALARVAPSLEDTAIINLSLDKARAFEAMARISGPELSAHYGEIAKAYRALACDEVSLDITAFLLSDDAFAPGRHAHAAAAHAESSPNSP